jgi:BOP1NT (NUC169) domain
VTPSKWDGGHCSWSGLFIFGTSRMSSFKASKRMVASSNSAAAPISKEKGSNGGGMKRKRTEETSSEPAIKASSKASISHKSLPREALKDETDQDAINLHVDDLSSDDEAPKNTIGNLPLEWYNDYDHIGYDVDGKPIGKKAGLGGKDRIDAFLKSQDDPLAFKWSVFDEANQEEIVLSKRDVEMLRNLHSGTYAHPEFDPTSMAYSTAGLYSDPVLDLEIHPLNGGTEPKRRFLPSKHEVRSSHRFVIVVSLFVLPVFICFIIPVPSFRFICAASKGT